MSDINTLKASMEKIGETRREIEAIEPQDEREAAYKKAALATVQVIERIHESIAAYESMISTVWISLEATLAIFHENKGAEDEDR